jgi:PAS domain S-box-containing protein
MNSRAMPKRSSISDSPAALRRRAERQSTKPGPPSLAIHTEADTRRLLHELEVHQIELEMQNAELRIARHEAEAMLEKYTDLYDFAPVGYFTLAADGAIRLVNLAGATLVGVERSKLTGRSFGMLVSPEHRAAFRVFLKQIFAGEDKQSAEFELAAGDRLPRLVNIEARRSPNGLECGALVVDITARKQAEIASARLAAIVKSSDDAIIGKDLNGIVTNWNKGAMNVFGYTAEEMLGCSIMRLIPADRRDEERHILAEIRRGNGVEHFETLRLTKDGRLIDVSVTASPIRDANGVIIGVSKVVRDISERKKAQEAMRRNEALFSSLVSQAPVGVYVVDARFRLQEANPMAMPVFENVHPLIGRDFSEIMRSVWPRRVADQIIGHFQHTLATGEAYQSPPFVERRRDIGVRETYEWQIQRVTLPAGEHGVVCFFNNITERARAEAAQRRLDALTATNLKLKQEIVRRKAVEEDLRATRQEQSRLLKQSSLQQKQLRELSHRMLHVQEEERKRISRELHDVITQTLVGINVHLAALTQGAAADPASLHQQISRTHLLVEKAVEIVHRFALELRPTMLDDLGLIPALHAYMKGFMEETGIRVSLKAFAKIEQSTGTVRTILYRIVQEALTNVARHAKASRVEVTIEPRDGILAMEIRDNGQGFETGGKPGAKKTSRLGLIGMRERVEMIGGRFRVESAVGEPTTICVEIPAEKAARKPSSKKTGGATGTK